MKRRQFLSSAMQATAGLILAPSLLLAQEKPATDSAAAVKKPVRPPAMNPELVKEFVTAGHKDLVKVKEMLASNPYFALATWDWGGGDFETALEGAGHMGEKEIARTLIEAGARPNIFVFTMLGETALVKAMVERYPALLKTRGPHGFTLWHHAEKGGAESAELRSFFESKGITQKHFPLFDDNGQPKS